MRCRHGHCNAQDCNQEQCGWFEERTTDKTNTINILEFDEDRILTLVSFRNSLLGRKEAEVHFVECLKENQPNILEHELEEAIDEGIAEYGTYKIKIVISS